MVGIERELFRDGSVMVQVGWRGRQRELQVPERCTLGRVAQIAGLPQGNAAVRIEPRGTRRVDASNVLDVRVEKTLPLRRARRTLGIYADVFNVTNRGVPLALGSSRCWARPSANRAGGLPRAPRSSPFASSSDTDRAGDSVAVENLCRPGVARTACPV